jgi:hypothetical protein
LAYSGEWTEHTRAGDGGVETEDSKSSSDTTADQSKINKTVERCHARARWNYAEIFTTGRKLMDTGDIPDDWKTANVKPIFK